MHTVDQTCPVLKAMGRTASRSGADMRQSQQHPSPSPVPEHPWSCRNSTCPTPGTLLGLRGHTQSSWQEQGMEVTASTLPPDRESWWGLAMGSAGWAQWGAPRVPEQRLSYVWGGDQPVPALCTPNSLASLPSLCPSHSSPCPLPPQGPEEGHSMGQGLGPGCELSHLPHSVARSSLISRLLVYTGDNTSPCGTGRERGRFED